MRSESELIKIKKIITVIALSVISIHLVIALGLTFFPKKFSGGKSKVGRVYEYLVHLGPFYREAAIKSSPHFVVTLSNDSVDLIASHARKYQKKPWKINELTLRDNVRRSADQFLRSRKKNGTSSFRKLAHATRSAFPDVREDDSVSWTYFHRWYRVEDNSWLNDTVFHYTFEWKSHE